MIIKYPTALYSRILPQNPSDGGNVTYTISNNDPPRFENYATYIPPAIERLPRPSRIYTDSERRKSLAEYIYTVSKSSSSIPRSSTKLLEVGQVLEFISTDQTLVDAMLVGNNLVLQHNLNILDLESLGITVSDIDIINDAAASQFKKLLSSLNLIRTKRKDLEIQIGDNKAKQNEITKTLSALDIIDTTAIDLAVIINDLQSKLIILKENEADYIAAANQSVSDAIVILDQLRAILQVVR